jgi:pimeloyl-ACP methyl ester carboxylesterase
MTPPETKYARNGDVRIAYQVVGNGPLDLFVVSGLASHLGLIWEEPAHARFCLELAKFSRLIMFDKRGTGLSDRHAGIPGPEQRIEDALAVLDAAGAERPALFGISEGGVMSMLLAATRPERFRALMLFGAYAQSPTHVWPENQVELRLDLVARAWGVSAMPPTVAPSMADDMAFRRAYSRFERESASAKTAAALLGLDHETDIRHVVPAVHLPTLVMHRDDDRRIAIENGRYLAAHLPTVTYVEMPGQDHLPHIGDADRVVMEIRDFLGSLSPAAPPKTALATVLAVKLDTTGRAGCFRDVARPLVKQWHGRELSGAGNWWFAAFDGPARAIRCASEISQSAVASGIALRAGLHNGEIARDGDAAGETGRLAALIAERAAQGEILVSGAVHWLIAGSGLRLTEHDALAACRGQEPLPLYRAG